MLTEYLEYVPALDNLPKELVQGIVQRLPPRRLLELEKREDFHKLAIGKEPLHLDNERYLILLEEENGCKGMECSRTGISYEKEKTEMNRLFF